MLPSHLFATSVSFSTTGDQNHEEELARDRLCALLLVFAVTVYNKSIPNQLAAYEARSMQQSAQPSLAEQVHAGCRRMANTMRVLTQHRDKGFSQAALHDRIDRMRLGNIDVQTYHLTLADFYGRPEITPDDAYTRVYDACFPIVAIPPESIIYSDPHTILYADPSQSMEGSYCDRLAAVGGSLVNGRDKGTRRSSVEKHIEATKGLSEAERDMYRKMAARVYDEPNLARAEMTEQIRPDCQQVVDEAAFEEDVDRA